MYSAGMMDPLHALSQPVIALIGATPAAASTLRKLGIATVQDLAGSGIFDVARRIADAASPATAAKRQWEPLPADLVDQSALNTSPEELADRPVSVLTLIGETLAAEIESGLGVTTVRELAQWQPYLQARAILSRAYGTDQGFDPEAPDDLVPANGRYPTERVQYEVLLFDEFVNVGAETDFVRRPPVAKRMQTGKESHAFDSERWAKAKRFWEKIKDLLGGKAARPLGSDGPLDVTEFLATDQGYDVPAIGGVLTFTQSWYGQGLALGTLIHSVALGPGESTKIAMIDWTRTTRAATSESIEESESLFSTVDRSRAISEITSSVARETQKGQSGASAHASASQSGGAEGGSRYGLRAEQSILDVFTNPFNMMNDTPQSSTYGTSWGRSASDTSSTSWSTTSGEREVAAEMSQNIMDRTHQASQSVRSRRASIVREVSQKESEQITTRTVTNYNHMHALTIQYYEVVQLNRAVVELSKADRCVFVPMKPLDFSDARVVDRFKSVIIRNGLNAGVTALALAEPDHLAFCSPHRTGRWDQRGLQPLSDNLGESVGTAEDPVLVFPLGDFAFADVFFGQNVPFASLVITDAKGRTTELPLLPGDGDGPLGGTLHLPSYLSTPLKDIRRVIARKTDAKPDYEGNTNIGCLWFGEDGWYTLNWTIDVPTEADSVILFEAQPTIGNSDLVRHLNDNRLYYSQAVWRSLDPTTIGMMLSRYTWCVGDKARPLVEIVDPTPAAMVANYLAFRISADDEKEKAAWLEKKRIRLGTRNEDLIPVPSGGVFAEAVLGRFNSAEKLDITRFWNWQDSPIPVQAPDIAPIQSGSRGESENLTPGSLGAPVLNIVNPPQLPDPQGMASVLAAVQNGGMFRDMSGLAATIGLAQAALAGVQEGAANAGAQAGQNAAVAAQLNERITGALIQAVASYFTGGKSLAAGGSGGGSSPAGMAGGISGQGAKINQGKDMDKRQGAASTGPATGAGGSTGSSSSTGSGSASGSVPQGAATNPNEVNAFRAAIGADNPTAGIPEALTELLNMAQGAAPPATSNAWPYLPRTTVNARVRQLAANANLFSQGGIGLCTAAAFYHHIIQRNPLQFYLFADKLYEFGSAELGALAVEPSTDLRSVDYSALKMKHPQIPPEADWMLISSLRDSENWFIDFEGDPEESSAIETSADEMSGWYRKTGWYSKVEYRTDVSLEALKAINKTANNHIAFWVKSKLVIPGATSTHMVTLEQPMVINEAAGTIDVDYWTWGEAAARRYSGPIADFLDMYLAAIVATF